MSARTSSRSSFAAAYMIAVVPSGPGALTSAPFARSFSVVARSLRSAASSNVDSAASTTEAAAMDTAMRFRMQNARCKRRDSRPITDVCILHSAFRITKFILDLRQNAAAVAELLHRDVVAIEQRHKQVGKARVLRILHVLTALDLAVRVAKDGRRQRIVVVLVAVAHVAAVQDRRVIQHGAAGFLRLREPLDELRE